MWRWAGSQRPILGLKVTGISRHVYSDISWVGDIRFTTGVLWECVRVKTSECSVAMHGDLAQPTDPNANAVTQQNSVKDELKTFYNEQYNRRHLDNAVSELPKQGAVGAIVDTHLPMDKWVHVAPESMNSFYAGKVSRQVICTNVSFLGYRKVHVLSLLRCRTTDISISACSPNQTRFRG